MFGDIFESCVSPLTRLFSTKAFGSHERLLLNSGLFDEQWYLARYPDVARAGVRPVMHYLTYGSIEGREPSPLFQTGYYLSNNPDVAGARINPLVHYLLWGEQEGRDPNPFFDADWYRHQHPDLVELEMNALAHYLNAGPELGCNPNPLFDGEWYLQTYPDARASGLNPLVHYITTGAGKGYKTSPVFMSKFSIWEKRGQSNPAAARFGGGDVVESRDALLRIIDACDDGRALTFWNRLRQITAVCNQELFQSIAQTLSVPGHGAAEERTKLPLVSVIMPVFNRRSLIREAVESVLSQSHGNLELIICDDGSTDETWDVCRSFPDSRVKLIQQKNAGAAAARNRCMEAACGDVFAYLDSDNLWHPEFLRVMVETLLTASGQPLAYANFFDVTVTDHGVVLNDITARDFDYELQLKSPFIDLNSIVHHRALFDTFGGFDEGLPALQDYDLIAKYAWPRDALHVPVALNIYQRISGIGQISSDKERSERVRTRVADKVAHYHAEGVGIVPPAWAKTATVLSWDMSRNHFAKAYSIAEALSRNMPVQLISFRFFDERVFAPIAGRKHPFELIAFDGSAFPEFLDPLCDALEAVSGDFIYAVKPRLTSFGIALLANKRRDVPVFLEANDLETMLHGKRMGKLHRTVGPDAVLARSAEASVPHALIWSQYLDDLAREMPLLFTHNENLNRHYGSKCLFMRNIKDELIFDPSQLNRRDLRRAMGVEPDQRILLFGGVVDDHKGVGELLRFVDMHEQYQLFVVGSVDTPELEKLRRTGSDRIRMFPPQGPEEMAKLNHVADAVVLWLDPREDVSHYQMPYKFTDAIAMGTPVVTSPVSDLARLQNVVWHVPYGDFEALDATLQRIFTNEGERKRHGEAGRRLFQKEFTYRAVRQNVALACHMTEPRISYPVAERFAGVFEEFCRATGADTQRLRALTRIP